MSAINKINENLLCELQEIRQEHNALKALYEKVITEQKIIEQTVRASEEKYRRLLESSVLGILAFDIDTHGCSFSNPAACKLFGYSELQGLSVNSTKKLLSLHKPLLGFQGTEVRQSKPGAMIISQSPL
ncbi:MAG: PAS domain-containing protein [bacterium]